MTLPLAQAVARSENRLTRVALADDQALLSQALGLIIEREPGLALVGTARSCADTLELALRTQPDVLLLEARFADGSGLALAATLRGLCPRTRLLILTTQSDDVTRQQALAAGAVALLGKHLSVDEVLSAIRLAAGWQPVGPMLPRRGQLSPATLAFVRLLADPSADPLSGTGLDRHAPAGGYASNGS
jgi:DNA-binding NarL/FixJ family response regulator